MERLDQLLEFLKNDQNDPFILYCLAMEYQNSDVEKAKEYYYKLLNEHEDYTGTYYHAAKLQDDLGNKTEAERIYKKGLEKTIKLGKTKNYQELQRAYRAFLDEHAN